MALAAPVVTGASLAQACSVCITGASDPTADAFNWSVLFLMATPYTVVAAIAGALYFSYRRAMRRGRAEERADTTIPLVFSQEESGR